MPRKGSPASNERPSMFGAALPASDIAFKGGVFGKGGAGKTFGACTFPCSPEHPLKIIKGDPIAADLALHHFRPRLDDGSIIVADAVVSEELRKLRAGPDYRNALRKHIDLEKTAFAIEDAIEDAVSDLRGSLILDNVTSLVKGISAWMDRKASVRTVSGKPVQYEWGMVYARLSRAIFQPFSVPTMPVILIAQVKKQYDGAKPIFEEGFSNRVPVYDARWASEIDHYCNYVIDVTPVASYKRDEIRKIVREVPAGGRATNIASFTKSRLWFVDREVDRFYDFTYPNLRTFMDAMDASFYSPPNTTILVPFRERKGKKRVLKNAYRGRFDPETGELMTDDVYVVP